MNEWCAYIHKMFHTLTLAQICPAFANSVDPDQLAVEEVNWSGSALFANKYVNLYQQSGSKNLIGWKLGGRGILIYSAWQGLNPYHTYPKIWTFVKSILPTKGCV